MRKFGRLSEWEVVTPQKYAEIVIDSISTESLPENSKWIDLASKQGEFVYAVYKKLGRDIASRFYSIPTSKLTYEFTRKVYALLKLDVNLIEQDYTSLELIQDDTLINESRIKINNHNMKFDVVVGNPPYQTKKEGTSDSPIYHLFMDLAYNLSDKVCLITPARFLFNAGKTPKDWNAKMLKDENIKVVAYYDKSSDVFPEIGFKGGVAITLRDTSIKFGKIGTFTKYENLNSILKRIENIGFKPISELIYTQNKFDLVALYKDNPDLKNIIGSSGREKRLTTSIFVQIPLFNEASSSKSDYKILGLINNTRTYRYLPSKYIEKHGNLNKYKVILPKSNGTGAFGEELSTPLIGETKLGYTQSFIGIGSFDTKIEAESCLKYVKSKFLRAMLGVLKVTQDNNKDVWSLVPLQNFKSDSDIDWSMSIEEIDLQLYKKYKLNKEEIEFIESMIKPMA